MSNHSLPQGALLLAQQFFPKHRLSVPDVCPVLGLSRDGFYKRLRMGRLNLRIRQDECGKKWILLSDLISYLYPEVAVAMTALPSEIIPSQEKKKRGRPPGSGNKPKAASQQKGGAR